MEKRLGLSRETVDKRTGAENDSRAGADERMRNARDMIWAGLKRRIKIEGAGDELH